MRTLKRKWLLWRKNHMEDLEEFDFVAVVTSAWSSKGFFLVSQEIMRLVIMFLDPEGEEICRAWVLLAVYFLNSFFFFNLMCTTFFLINSQLYSRDIKTCFLITTLSLKSQICFLPYCRNTSHSLLTTSANYTLFESCESPDSICVKELRITCSCCSCGNRMCSKLLVWLRLFLRNAQLSYRGQTLYSRYFVSKCIWKWFHSMCIENRGSNISMVKGLVCLSKLCSFN